TVTAQLTLLSGSNADEVLAAARAAWAAYDAGRQHKLGGDIVPLAVQSVLKVAGVYNVATPGLARTVVAADAWARCTRINITAETEQVDG
ncbi:MAG TPA: baseplate assembly protein, partial [Neisseria sp.]|nr:baseplate assembly protein [Neisseria sp.]